MAINIGREMALPMEQIIGGPLQAIVKAQSLAASETASFIQSVGLSTSGQDTEARMVNFDFKRTVPADADGTSETLTEETIEMNVPLLTIVPVPFIRVEEATIDFECKVSSSTLDTSKTAVGVEASASGGFWGVKFSVKASYSNQRTHKSEVNKSATLKVHVKAVQDTMPGGLEKLLEILESAINDNQKAA